MSIFIALVSSSMICCMMIILIVRNRLLLNWLMRLINEEDVLTKQRIFQNKTYDGFRRFDSLPPHWKLWLCFWFPLKHYEKPLSEFYQD